MKAVRIRITSRLLKEVLHMPEETEIIGASVDESSEEITFLLWHPNLPSADREPPLVSPIIHYMPEVYTWDWNMPKEEE